MLRELKKYTAECEAQLGTVDCLEIITIEAPDAENAILALTMQDWLVEERRQNGEAGTWHSTVCPACLHEEEFQVGTPFSGPLAAEARQEAVSDYRD